MILRLLLSWPYCSPLPKGPRVVILRLLLSWPYCSPLPQGGEGRDFRLLLPSPYGSPRPLGGEGPGVRGSGTASVAQGLPSGPAALPLFGLRRRSPNRVKDDRF